MGVSAWIKDNPVYFFTKMRMGLLYVLNQNAFMIALNTIQINIISQMAYKLGYGSIDLLKCLVSILFRLS
jgi:hypothetical protein